MSSCKSYRTCSERASTKEKGRTGNAPDVIAIPKKKVAKKEEKRKREENCTTVEERNRSKEETETKKKQKQRRNKKQESDDEEWPCLGLFIIHNFKENEHI